MPQVRPSKISDDAYAKRWRKSVWNGLFIGNCRAFWHQRFCILASRPVWDVHSEILA